MASVKKTRKSSETKQAKQPGIRSPKAKASKRSAVSVESKAKKAAAARALAAKQRAVKKSTKGTTQKAKMKANAKTKTAAALTSRATPPATKNKNKAVATAPPAKKTAVTERRGGKRRSRAHPLRNAPRPPNPPKPQGRLSPASRRAANWRLRRRKRLSSTFRTAKPPNRRPSRVRLRTPFATRRSRPPQRRPPRHCWPSSEMLRVSPRCANRQPRLLPSSLS